MPYQGRSLPSRGNVPEYQPYRPPGGEYLAVRAEREGQDKTFLVLGRAFLPCRHIPHLHGLVTTHYSRSQDLAVGTKGDGRDGTAQAPVSELGTFQSGSEVPERHHLCPGRSQRGAVEAECQRFNP